MNTSLSLAASSAPSTRPAAAPRFHALRSWLSLMRSRRARLVADYEEELINPWEAARRGFVDDVVAPSETRVRVVQALRALRTKRAAGPAKKHGNIPL